MNRFRLFKKKNPEMELFLSQFQQFKEMDIQQRLPMSKTDMYPCLKDNTGDTGFDAHYIYHPAWAARIISSRKPTKHVDISSILHFSTILSAFVPTEFYDYRPAKLYLDNLISAAADLTNLPFLDNSVESLSCMHTIEHIGLGRYGDPLDPEGDVKAIHELMRVCAPGGDLLLAVPVGDKKIMYNAHRIYDPEEFSAQLTGFVLKEFSLITDNNQFIRNTDFAAAKNQQYGCGCYWFQKLENGLR
jgi:hypothetical protein